MKLRYEISNINGHTQCKDTLDKPQYWKSIPKKTKQKEEDFTNFYIAYITMLEHNSSIFLTLMHPNIFFIYLYYRSSCLDIKKDQVIYNQLNLQDHDLICIFFSFYTLLIEMIVN